MENKKYVQVLCLVSNGRNSAQFTFINAANLHPFFEFHNILCQKTHFYSTNNAKRHTNLHPTIARNKNRASHENL